MRKVLTLTTLLALLLAPIAARAQNSPFPMSLTATLQSAVSATGNGSTLNTSQLAVVTFQVSGTFTATVSFEGSNDSTNWNSLTCYTLDSQTAVSSASAAGIWRCNVGGISLVRSRVTWSSGTSVTVVANGTSNAVPTRDASANAGAITGQLKGTQLVAPTCAPSTNAGTAFQNFTNACQVTGGGTDSFVRGLIALGFPSNGGNGVGTVAVTFVNAYTSAPACVASWDGTGTYGYYVYAVTPTTTQAVIKLGGRTGVTAQQTPQWSPGDAFSLICAGTQS